jgi:hypothetical protein
LVEWSDNIDISDKSPSQYFPTFSDRYDTAGWQKMRRLHALPMGWEKMEYPVFLTERRKLMAKVIREGFEKLK